MNSLWIKHPRAVFTSNQLDASGGLVIADGRILEVLAAGQQPSGPVRQVFAASTHVV